MRNLIGCLGVLWLVGCAGRGEDEPFATTRQALGPPVVSTMAATLVTASTATLNGSGNPNELTTTAWFRYSLTNPGTCNDTFGTRAPSSSLSDSNLGSGTAAVLYARAVTGLLPGTTFYFCAIAGNASGTSFGPVLSFTTLPAAPTVSTGSATNRTGTTATLNGSTNPGGAATTAWFRFSTASPGTCNDTFGTRAPISGGSAIPAGTSSVAFSQNISGLSPGTTYYYCAIAQNVITTTLGAVQSFVTPLPPVVTTQPATSTTNSSAVLNGLANPNGATTTAWFRYATTNPGACNDTFGTRAPSSGGSTLGGSSAQTYSQTVSGLSAGTTYFFCAIASSAEGTAFGAVLSFATADVPTATTVAPTLVTSSAATLNGSGNPTGGASTGWFRYSFTSPGTCNDSFGTRSSDSVLGTGTAEVLYSQAVSGLLPGTTYYFCAITTNPYGTSFGAVLSFTTLPAAPTVSTGSATNRTGTTAALNGSTNPGGAATTAWFRFSTASPGTCNDTFGTRAPVGTGGSAIPAGTSSVAFSQNISGLSPGTTYYYCAIAQNVITTTLGAVQSFVTPLPPFATTQLATSVTSSSAVLNGLANPNGATTTAWFRYATTNPGACSDTFGTRAPSSGGSTLGGSTAQAYSQTVSGLSPGSTYFFCAIASSAEGTAFGGVLSFATPAAPPAVTTLAPTLVTPTTATGNAAINPTGSPTTAWVRYATIDPGVCNDTFGTRAPTSGGVAIGAGNTSTPISVPLAGLSPATTYFFCALASNAAGPSVGAVVTFTTPNAPATTTLPASVVTSTSASLSASTNPNLSQTTLWFRYSATSPGACDDTFGTRTPPVGGSDLGAGSTAIVSLEPITSLSPGTTYFFCAIAQNTWGTSLGSLLSFTTPAAAPTVSTTAASALSGGGATLNGSATPNGGATTGWFRYGTTNPGSCDDTFGTRAPATGGAALGNGSTSVSFAQSLTGLTPGATYFFCALAQNAAGLRFGNVLSFTLPEPPAVSTLAASSVTDTAATLNGTANPNGTATTGWFRYATTSPGTCDDVFGARAPATGGTALGAGSAPASFTFTTSGLAPATTYFFCAIGQSAIGTRFGSVMSFTTAATALRPTVITAATTDVTATTATLNGTANPNGAATTGWFRYATTSPGTCDDVFGTRAPATGGTALGAGATAAAYSEALTGLSPATTYFVCAIAQNAAGTAFGAVQTFTSAAAPQRPTVTTSPATSVLATTATLNGAANPNGQATTAWFRYATTSPGTCDDTFGTRLPSSGATALGAGSSSAAFSEALFGLAPGTTYFFCALAQNTTGLAVGNVSSFVTGAAPPLVTTGDTTRITGTGATLAGSVDPRGSDALAWFRVGDSAPSTCDDAFGSRAPTTGGLTLDAGSGPSAFTIDVTGLAPKRTYFSCAAASNVAGAAFGGLKTFTTLAVPATVTTGAVELSGDTATLRGTANPNGSETTGWFRHSPQRPQACDDTFGTRVPTTGVALGAGRAPAPFSETVTLPEGTSYVCAIASNEAGLGLGEVQTVTVTATPGPKEPKGCGCGVEGGGLAWVLALVLLARRR